MNRPEKVKNKERKEEKKEQRKKMRKGGRRAGGREEEVEGNLRGLFDEAPGEPWALGVCFAQEESGKDAKTAGGRAQLLHNEV